MDSGTSLAPPPRERLHIVVAGHVDHGKSTVIGRLLADSGALPEGKLDQVRALCARTARPFEYAFLLDALKDEQAQGITIDAARVFFKTPRRDYLLLDAPGHIEFLRNMVTGAARAEAALLVIDAKDGAQENSYRHGYLLGMLGIRQIAVLINKMDLAGYAQSVYADIAAAYGAFLQRLGITATCFIPVQGRDGDNLATRSSAMGWYQGPTVLDVMEGFQPTKPLYDRPLRIPVQDIYKFTKEGDDRRIVAGTIEAGTLRAGDELVFLPSGKKSHVQTIEAFHRPPQTEASAGRAVGFTLREQIYVSRGEIAAPAAGPHPHVTSRLLASLFWLGPQPLVRDREYTLKLGTARVSARVERIHRVINAADLQASEDRDRVERNEVAECTVSLLRALAFDLADDIPGTGRFVLVDQFEIRGGGIIRAALPDGQQELRARVLRRNDKWEPSRVAPEHRAERYGQRALLLLLTGPKGDDGRKVLAKDLEARLFADGRVVYYLGMAGVVYGLDADIAERDELRPEHLRRLGELAHILLDAGLILIATAAELSDADLEVIRLAVAPDLIQTVWVGPATGRDRAARAAVPDLAVDLVLPDPAQDGVHRLKGLLQERGWLFRPY